jgi:hypothetical protein
MFGFERQRESEREVTSARATWQCAVVNHTEAVRCADEQKVKLASTRLALEKLIAEQATQLDDFKAKRDKLEGDIQATRQAFREALVRTVEENKCYNNHVLTMLSSSSSNDHQLFDSKEANVVSEAFHDLLSSDQRPSKKRKVSAPEEISQVGQSSPRCAIQREHQEQVLTTVGIPAFQQTANQELTAASPVRQGGCTICHQAMTDGDNAYDSTNAKDNASNVTNTQAVTDED